MLLRDAARRDGSCVAYVLCDDDSAMGRDAWRRTVCVVATMPAAMVDKVATVKR